MSGIPGFFDYLFGNRSGWACLGWLDGDPRLGELDAKHQEWYELPANRETLDRRAEWHAAQGHNLYVRQVLFAKKRGTQTNALPSPILWQDDARIDTPASMLVETSEGNYQALIMLDRDASTAERKRLMTAWRNARPGADDCSSDPVHFVRVPGGINRKGPGGNGTWRVRAVVRNPKPLPADRLLARCRAPGRGETHASPVGAGALDRQQLDYWQAHIDQLLSHDRMLPRAFVRDTPGRRILELRAMGKGMLFHPSGTWDASRERLWLANSLVIARYLDEQIAALLWHFEVAETVEIKGDAAIWADIERVIVMARSAHPNIAPRLYGARPEKAPKIARGRASSHVKTVEQVYSLLLDHKAGADAIITTGDLAAQLGCHRRTVSTILAQLRDAGRIAWRRLGQHGGLVVSFISDVIIDQPAKAAQPPATPPIAIAPVALGETGPLVGCVSPDRAEADHISDLPDALLLRALASRYLGLPASVVGELSIDKKTGEVRSRRVSRVVNTDDGITLRPESLYRRSAKHFALLVADEGYPADAAIEAYQAEQQHRKDLAAREWALFFARLRGMTDQQLLDYIGGGCRRDVAELARDGSTFDKHLYQTRLKCAKQHLGWRGLTMPKKPTRSKVVQPGDAWAPEDVPVVMRRLPLESLPDTLPGGVDVAAMVARLKAEREAAHAAT